MARRRIKTRHAANGSPLPLAVLDLANAEQLALSDEAETQAEAMDSTLIYAFCYGGSARITWGAEPEASTDAGSIPLVHGSFFPIPKARTDLISVISADGIEAGVVDLVPALEVTS